MSRSALAAGLRRLRGQLAVQQHNSDSDEQLLLDFTTRRDDSAFAVLVRRHGPMVLHVCRRVLGHEQDAEDAFQATFLVLAQNAASLRNKTALPSWLHGTAFRTAMKAKQSAARRRKREGQTPARPPTNPSDELLWCEVRSLLDEEIAQLPEKSRSVFVLCCLEELSQTEASRRLGLKVRTVSNRLAEARKRLSKQLARRGVELTAVLAATTLAAQPAAALPAELLTATVKVVLATAAGEEFAGIVSASVAELIDSTTATLMVSKAKMAAVVLLAAGLTVAASGALVRWYGRASEPLDAAPEAPAAKAEDKPKAASPQREATKSVEIDGRVFGPDGKPKAGAKLLLLGGDKKVVELGVTAADGRFSVSVPKAGKDFYLLIARTNDTGIDIFGTANWEAGKNVELRLVKDQPIRGRILNTEGKPVAGVHVSAAKINFYPNNSLDMFLSHWKNLQVGRPPLGGGYGGEFGAMFTTTTDAEGRFVLRGLGEERFIPLRLSGAGIADAELWVVTRPHFDPEPYNQAVLDNTSKRQLEYLDNGRMLHGPDVTFIVEPEKIVRGVVKDAGTGKGRANVLVQLSQRRGRELQARTDAAGRYEIRKARKAKSYQLVVPSDPATGYVGSEVKLDDSPGYQPVHADITLKKGVIITGKMIDRATGKLVAGGMRVAVLNDNPFVKEYPGFDSAAWGSVGGTDAKGVFRIVSIPGPVLLIGGPSYGNDGRYNRSIPDPKYRRYFREESNSLWYCPPGGGFSPIMGIYFKVLEIKPDATVIEQDVVLERSPAMAVRMQDAGGKPLTLVYVAGTSDQGGCEQFAESSCSVYGVQPGKPRVMIFYHPTRKLAGAITLKGDEKQPVAVKLGPAGTIEGRLLDADGKALAGVRIHLNYYHPNADSMNRCIHDYRQIETDAKGAFRFEDVLPGFKFELSFRRGRQRFVRETKPADPAIQVKPGERRDLGDIRLRPKQ